MQVLPDFVQYVLRSPKPIYSVLAFGQSVFDGQYAVVLNTALWRPLAYCQLIALGGLLILSHASFICRATLSGGT
ncbi:hypothetical protein DS509_25300 [Salmonella enterica subsp. diarizonae]|nr:hypothetical protein [Salmonella enterica subsp. diarizonae]